MAIPLILGVYYVPGDWLSLSEQNTVAATLFIIAALTDWFDGYLARTLGQTSAFGAFLDPVADKLMVAAVLTILLQLDRVDAFIAAIIIGREITISALREWMALLGNPKSVAVSFVGKLKTTAQLIALPLLLLSDRWIGPVSCFDAGTVLIYIAAALTLISMAYYLRRAGPFLKTTLDG